VKEQWCAKSLSRSVLLTPAFRGLESEAVISSYDGTSESISKPRSLHRKFT
jgi:hypothetical protein